MKKQSFTKMKRAFLALVVVTMAMPAMAQAPAKGSPPPPCSSGTDCVGTIDLLYVTSAGATTNQAAVYIKLSTGLPTSCTGLYYALRPGTNGYDQLYNLLLDAAVFGEKVDIRVTTGVGGCPVAYVIGCTPDCF